MALKPFQLLSFLFLALSLVAHSLRDIPRDNNPSPFDSIYQLEGCQKGNKTKGLSQLKQYLQKYGYLERLNPTDTNADDDNFDDALDSAIRTYQQNYHIQPTGVLDAETLSKMAMPRCGVPDIVHGINTMQTDRMMHHDPTSKSIHTVSRYVLFPGNPKWPPSKTHLTYEFLDSVPKDAKPAVAKAFQRWASATHFKFSQAGGSGRADLKIGFVKRDHGDGTPFDGPGGALAHATPPTYGILHFDSEEKWSIGTVANRVDVESVALHEIGHLLGLEHSSVKAAVMFPTIGAGETKDLHADDIRGIKALYNV